MVDYKSLWTNPKIDDDPDNPTGVWDDYLEPIQPVEKAVLPHPKSAKKEGYLRCVCISDTHSGHDYMRPLPKGDVLIHAGDFSYQGGPTEVESFAEYLKGLDFKHKVVIAGNHDITFDTAECDRLLGSFYSRPIPPYSIEEVQRTLKHVCTYLENEPLEIEGVTFYGSPYTPEFYNWAFQYSRGPDAVKMWSHIPDETDVLITHGPPIGHGDKCTHGGRAGCVDLLREIQLRVKPKFHVFGHIHEGYGITTDGQTTFINASTCNLRYKTVHNPIVFDVPIPGEAHENDDTAQQDNEDDKD